MCGACSCGCCSSTRGACSGFSSGRPGWLWCRSGAPSNGCCHPTEEDPPTTASPPPRRLTPTIAASSAPTASTPRCPHLRGVTVSWPPPLGSFFLAMAWRLGPGPSWKCLAWPFVGRRWQGPRCRVACATDAARSFVVVTGRLQAAAAAGPPSAVLAVARLSPERGRQSHGTCASSKAQGRRRATLAAPACRAQRALLPLVSPTCLHRSACALLLHVRQRKQVHVRVRVRVRAACSVAREASTF